MRVLARTFLGLLIATILLSIIHAQRGVPALRDDLPRSDGPGSVGRFVTVDFHGSEATVTAVGPLPIAGLCGFFAFKSEGALEGSPPVETEWSANLTGTMFDPEMALMKGQSHQIARTPLFGRIDQFVHYENFEVTGIVFTNMTSAGGELGGYCLSRFKGQLAIFRYHLEKVRMDLERHPEMVRREIRGQIPIASGSFAEAFHKTLKVHIYDRETGDMRPGAARIIDRLLRRLEHGQEN